MEKKFNNILFIINEYFFIKNMCDFILTKLL